MGKNITYILSLCTLCLLIGNAPHAQSVRPSATQPPAPRQAEVLSNQSIIRLVQAKFREKTILTIIRTSPANFDLTTTALIHLKKNGVNERVIEAMIARQAINTSGGFENEPLFSAEDEAFFKSAPRLSFPKNNRQTPPTAKSTNDEVDIFGSRSGAQSGTRTPGALGEQTVTGEVAGSATVRIIKPPSESNGEPKLERAQKLDNQAIIDLVEAGFSEGTIVRKIELNQVEFDLSPKAMDRLKKSRVSERIIKAMQNAMDELK